jgi:hypothetical protein
MGTSFEIVAGTLLLLTARVQLQTSHWVVGQLSPHGRARILSGVTFDYFGKVHSVFYLKNPSHARHFFFANMRTVDVLG